MFAPEEQQIEICLLKSNLEEIVDALVTQRTALPELDAEYEQKSRETIASLKQVRAVKLEIERLKQENVHLTAKRVQLKRQCDELAKKMETAREYRENHTQCLKQEKQELEFQIRKYENALQEKADRFRQTLGYYNEEEINSEIHNVNNIIAELNDRLTKKKDEVDELKAKVDVIQPQVPETLLEIIEKLKLEEVVKLLTEKHEALIIEKQKNCN